MPHRGNSAKACALPPSSDVPSQRPSAPGSSSFRRAWARGMTARPTNWRDAFRPTGFWWTGTTSSICFPSGWGGCCPADTTGCSPGPPRDTSGSTPPPNAPGARGRWSVPCSAARSAVPCGPSPRTPVRSSRPTPGPAKCSARCAHEGVSGCPPSPTSPTSPSTPCGSRPVSTYTSPCTRYRPGRHTHRAPPGSR